MRGAFYPSQHRLAFNGLYIKRVVFVLFFSSNRASFMFTLFPAYRVSLAVHRNIFLSVA